MIRSGISLSRSVELAVQWDRILALGSIGVWTLVHSFMPLLMFIAVLAILFILLLFIVVMRVGVLFLAGRALCFGSQNLVVIKFVRHVVNVADAHDVADVFLYRDSSIALLLDMRRRFKAGSSASVICWYS